MHLIAHLVVHLTKQMFVGRIQTQMQMFKVRIQMKMHWKKYGGIWMRIQMFNIQMHLQLLTSLICSLLVGLIDVIATLYGRQMSMFL